MKVKKILTQWVIWAVMLIISPAFAAENYYISGVGAGGGGVDCQMKANGDVSIVLNGFRAVRTTKEGNFRGGQGTQNVPDNVNQDWFFTGGSLEGAMVEIYGLGTDWQDMPTHVDQLDSSKVLGTAVIQGGTVTITLRTHLAKNSGTRITRFNGRIKTPNGWGWMISSTLADNAAKNSQGKWLVAVPVDTTTEQCVPLTPAMRAAVAQHE